MTALVTVLVGLTLALALFFPIYAAFRADIFTNAPGRALFGFSVVVASVLCLAFARQLGFAPPEWSRVLVYGSIIIGLGLMDYSLVRATRKRAARLAREYEEAHR